MKNELLNLNNILLLVNDNLGGNLVTCGNVRTPSTFSLVIILRGEISANVTIGYHLASLTTFLNLKSPLNEVLK